jgi:molybdate transport system regulatory protein
MRRPRVRLRIEFASAGWLGPGKIGLLESVARTGSLTGAAADCGMSYKRAWVLLKAANEIFAAPLVEMSKGGRGGGGGARVTAAGEAVVSAYRQAEREATAATAAAFAGLKASATDAPRPPEPRRRRGPSSRRRLRRA